MVHRFLHLSDIHFGQEKDGSLVKHDHIREALIGDARGLAKKRGVASRILVTGDTAYSGTVDEYATAIQWLEKLANACGCDVTHVSTIPGNHDCDHKAISNQARMIYATLRASGPELLQAQLHGIMADGEAANPFLPKLHAYRQFANGFGCDFGSPARPFWLRHFDLPGGIKLNLFGLTSVQISDKDDAAGKMVLGNQQYTIAEEANTINIVLIHHPLDWFIDETEASQFLQNNARVIMVGHEHALAIQKTEDATTNKEWLVIYAGAVTPPGGVFGYTYNWLEFSCEEKDGEHYLVVEIFPRVWNQPSVRFDADHSRLVGLSESVTIKLHCPNVSVPVASHSVFAAPAAVAAVEAPTSAPDPPSEPQAAIAQGQSTMDNQTAGFDRLRYLFWRYLDWRQRLKVLVDVDALPKTSDQPVPQTLERVALEAAAKSAGKLHDLWEAIMPLVPEDKRGANPFPTKDR
ncbi:MAG: metallophosphoesterase [Acidobacteria bacterium]|nr:metallophosphoesterase [Acidobacteriota bacterium]